jgi:hypothetical protein
MQLTRHLLATAAAALSCSGSAPAPQRAELSLHAGYYGDSDRVSVWNPSLRARVPLSRRVTATAGYGLDVISAASFDVVSSASRSLERRHEATAGVQVALDGRTSVGASARDSREPDYLSHGAALTLDRESEARDRAVHVELRGRWDRVGPGWTLQHRADLYAGTAAASLTQVLDRVTLLRVGLQADVLQGLQSSVYRYVPIDGAWYAERVPDLRVRGAASVRVQRSLAPTLAAAAEYGLTVDTWGLVAHAAEVALRWEPAAWVLVEVRARALSQGGTTFYQGTYATLPTLRTRDRLLGPMDTLWPQASVRLTWPGWPAPPAWELGARAGWMHQEFGDYTPLRARDAGVGELWLTRWF